MDSFPTINPSTLIVELGKSVNTFKTPVSTGKTTMKVSNKNDATDFIIWNTLSHKQYF